MIQSLTRYLVVGFALTAVACTQDAGEEPDQVLESNDPIVGGKISVNGAWPGAVALYKGSQACGGTLVHPSWVITAAHCVSSSATGGFTKVVIGTNRLSGGTGGETRSVDKAIKHQSYGSGGSQNNDIAILHLSQPSTKPVAKLVSSAQLSKIIDGANTTVVGWGTTSEGGSTSNDLREVDVPIIGNTTCKTYSGYSRVTDNMICAGFTNGAKDSCQGDSGGPLYQKIDNQFVQIGVVSWGIGCARARAPGVYTRLGNYLDWIKTTTQGAVDANAATPGTGTSGGTSGATSSSGSTTTSSSGGTGGSTSGGTGGDAPVPPDTDGDANGGDSNGSDNNDWWSWWW